MRERLGQSKDQPFIANLLALNSDEASADYLVEQLGSSVLSAQTKTVTDLLNRTLRKLRVRKVRLNDFAPSRRTLEPGDIETVVAEFRHFLKDALQADADETPVIELN